MWEFDSEELTKALPLWKPENVQPHKRLTQDVTETGAKKMRASAAAAYAYGDLTARSLQPS